jgi:hypothetical protein
MNDDLMFEYLVQMGQMRPEEAELKKKQAMVDALRKNSMTPMQGEMVGKHYVAPGIGQAIAQLGQGYLASQAQGGVDQQMRGMNDRQRVALEQLRKRRMAPGAMPTAGLGGGMNTEDYGFDMPGAGY